jgi:hypothetical protein
MSEAQRLNVCIAAAAMFLVPTAALAEEPAPAGHYIESSIPESSSAFRSVSESTSRTFEKVEKTLQEVDGRLAKMALSIGLAGEAVGTDPASLWDAKLDARSDTFSYEFGGIQVRLNQTQEGYEAAFRAALERALAALAAEGTSPVVPCTPKRGSALGALAGGGPGGAAAGPSTEHCPGPDLSQEIARRWDSDAVLQERLLQIVGGELGPIVIGLNEGGEPIEYGGALAAGGWPRVTTYSEPGAVLPLAGQSPAGATWLHPADLVVSMPELAEALDTIDTLADDARSRLQDVVAALPRDANGQLLQDEEHLGRIQAVQNKARGIRSFTDTSRAEVGAALWETLARLRKKGKKAGWADVGLCLNPAGFGGCEGTDVTDVVAEALAADKKLTARLEALRDDLVVPDVSVP